MTSPPDPRLERLLGGAALAAVRRRMRRHFERGGGADGALLLGDLGRDAHEALALLIGRPARASRSLRLDLAQLEARLQAAGVAGSLREALERLDGPIADVAGERAALVAAWSALRSRPGREARLHAWLQAGGAAGLLKRLGRRDVAAAEGLLGQASAVLARLPAAGMPRAQLAAQALGDAHALDRGRPVATLVLAAWRHAEAASGLAKAGCVDAAASDSAAEEARLGAVMDARVDAQVAEERDRDVWARAGVLVNELARPALALNLPPPIDLGAVPWLHGEPVCLTLRWLLRTSPRWPLAGRAVFVCENPNLMAIAADRLGPRCAPLVCTDGMPAASQRTLLTQLARSGARLHYHGDFDWPGVGIANHVIRTFGAAPWRLGAADYAAAADDPATAHHALAGSAVEAVWDAGLAAAMQRHGLAIAEEALADRLLDDLSQR